MNVIQKLFISYQFFILVIVGLLAASGWYLYQGDNHVSLALGLTATFFGLLFDAVNQLSECHAYMKTEYERLQQGTYFLQEELQVVHKKNLKLTQELVEINNMIAERKSETH